MKRFLRVVLTLSGLCLLYGCGGGSPSVSLSTKSLTFGDELQGTASQPLPVTLTNSGTATLTIASIAASANFAQTNNCGSTLAAGANCTINVTLTPNTTGSVSGTVSFTDNAAGSPQTVSLSGTGSTPQYTLSGYCWGGIEGEPNRCGIGQDLTDCPVGQIATPTTLSGFCLPPQSRVIDASTTCSFKTPNGLSGGGSCLENFSDTGGSCSVQGQECGAAELPPCCSGFVCAAASDRAFCQPATGGSASKARSSWDQGLANRLR